MTHEGHTVCFEAPVSAPASLEETDAVARVLHDRLIEYCDVHGYEPLRSTLSVSLTSPEMLVVSATVRARYDGTWGSVRRALEEDGLLRPSDRADAPAGFWGWGDPDSVRTAFGFEPMSTPAAGDYWYDTRDGQAYVYGDGGWAKVTVPDPDPEPDRSLYEGVWTTDEICVRPEITGAVDGPTVVTWPGGAKTLSAGDTLSFAAGAITVSTD